MTNPGNHLGYAGAAQPVSAQELYPALDPLLVQRKGCLILVATADADRSALAWLCREFYESRSYDPIPTLVRCLAQAYRDHPALAAECPLAVVLRGVELNMVGADQAVVRLMRYGVVRDLFNAQASRTGFRVAMTRQPVSPQIPPIYSAQWRLVTGDTLLLTVQGAARHIGARTLRRSNQVAGSASRAAALLARLPRVPDSAPIIVMQQGQFSPVPELPGAKPPPEAEPESQRQRGGRSPIWVALAFAVLAVVTTVWITGARLQPEDIEEYMLTVFFPAPTPTPEPTPTMEANGLAGPLVYAPPSLVSPYAGARLQGPEVALIWEWQGELASNEFFELILRPAGDEPPARTLTRASRHVATIGADGWYAWTVRVVDGAERPTVRPLSPEAEPVSFHWRAE